MTQAELADQLALHYSTCEPGKENSTDLMAPGACVQGPSLRRGGLRSSSPDKKHESAGEGDVEEGEGGGTRRGTERQASHECLVPTCKRKFGTARGLSAHCGHAHKKPKVATKEPIPANKPKPQSGDAKCKTSIKGNQKNHKCKKIEPDQGTGGDLQSGLSPHVPKEVASKHAKLNKPTVDQNSDFTEWCKILTDEQKRKDDLFIAEQILKERSPDHVDCRKPGGPKIQSSFIRCLRSRN